MRLVSYFILAYVILGIQVGVSGFVRMGGAAPNIVLLAALFIAMNAPRNAALLGCFGLGLMQDLLTQQALGVHAFSYGIVAGVIVLIAPVLVKDHPLTHVALALLASTIVSLLMLIQGWIRAPRINVATLLYATLYTALLAPILLTILQRGCRRIFAFQTARRRI